MTAGLQWILAAGFNLQIGIVGLGPLIPEIRVSNAMSSATAGLLETIPFLCLGLFTFVGVKAIKSLGSERLVGLALALILVGTLLRASVTSATLLLVCTGPLGVGMALLAIALPVVVKERFPDRAGAVIGAYVAALAAGASIAAVTAVPIARALGSWHAALAIQAVPAGAALLLWSRSPRFGSVQALESFHAVAHSIHLPQRQHAPRTVLALAAVFASQTVVYSATISWIAALYRDRGWSSGTAGLTTAAVSVVAMPAAWLIPRR